MTKNKNQLPKVHHLIRYFILLGGVVFFGYVNHWQDDVFLILIGPLLFLAQGFKGLLLHSFAFPSSQTFNFYGLLLPFTLIYFFFLGFLIKQLNQERGIIRFMSLFALMGFLAFIHFVTWNYLSSYFSAV